MTTASKLVGVPARRAADPTVEELDERRAADLARVGRFIGRLQASGYFGKITINLQNGKLVELRTEQVLKVDDL
jgi:hypothetical protein